MAKVTWLGEDEKDTPGPSFTMWYGQKFPKDVPVEVTDEAQLAKARGNIYFRVEDVKNGNDKNAPRPRNTSPL